MTLRSFAALAGRAPSSIHKAEAAGRLLKSRSGDFNPEQPTNREFLRSAWAQAIAQQLQANRPAAGWSCLVAERAGSNRVLCWFPPCPPGHEEIIDSFGRRVGLSAGGLVVEVDGWTVALRGKASARDPQGQAWALRLEENPDAPPAWLEDGEPAGVASPAGGAP